MRKKWNSIIVILLVFILIMTFRPMKANADSLYPNVVTTDIDYSLTSTVDVNFNAGSITGLIGRSPLSEFWKATGLTEEDITKNYYPVVYTHESSLEVAVTDALQAKATEIGAQPIVTYIDIFLFKQTTESTLVSEFPNYVEYTIKLPSSLDSSEMEYAVICYFDGKMQLFKDTDDAYSTLTFSTNKSAPYAILRAWDGTFDNIENGAYIDGTSISAEETTDELDEVPKTGEFGVMGYLGIMIVAAGAMYLYLNKKEKQI